MKVLFPNSFYSLITPPNKEEIFKALKTAKVNVEASKEIKWNRHCQVEVGFLSIKEMGELFIPTLDLFLNELGMNVRLPLQFEGIWKNTYRKGGFQETHEHPDVDLSGCFFLEEDSHPDTGKFYFYNRHSSELNSVWRELMDNSPDFNGTDIWFPEYNVGDIILFPSYMLHGVTSHRLKNPRTTVSFNVKFLK